MISGLEAASSAGPPLGALKKTSFPPAAPLKREDIEDDGSRLIPIARIKLATNGHHSRFTLDSWMDLRGDLYGGHAAFWGEPVNR